MKYHRQNPDDAVAATARFKEVSEAYETLTKESDPEDMFRGMSFDPSMFAQMFRTRVHVVTVQLDLKEIVEGANVEACMQTTQKCKSCVRKAATKKVVCKTCG
jgi:DnaJ-class molecular chaperone